MYLLWFNSCHKATKPEFVVKNETQKLNQQLKVCNCPIKPKAQENLISAVRYQRNLNFYQFCQKLNV